jgi:hypothetical protein
VTQGFELGVEGFVFFAEVGVGIKFLAHFDVRLLTVFETGFEESAIALPSHGAKVCGFKVYVEDLETRVRHYHAPDVRQ